jgi:UMF1 family MFS transporter
MMGEPLRKKELVSWCLFDFANSTYATVIAAVVFPVYYSTYIVSDGTGDLWWGRAISLSMLIVALVSPVLGGIADYTGLRKRFLFAFTAICILSVSALPGLSSGMALEGFVLIVMANIGMEGGLVFYNSYLNRIAPPGYTGRVSSWGFGVGYAGSVISLLMVLPLVNAGLYGLSWMAVAVLFALFSLPAFLFLPSDTRDGGIIVSSLKGLRYTLGTLKRLISEKNTRRFLLAYFLYADGVNTVIVFSGIFAVRTLGFDTTELVLLYITVQVSALIGAFSMAGATDKCDREGRVLGYRFYSRAGAGHCTGGQQVSLCGHGAQWHGIRVFWGVRACGEVLGHYRAFGIRVSLSRAR